LLLDKKMDEYTPTPYLTFSIHLDGNRDRHDTSVCRSGVFDKCVEVIRRARARGSRVTANCTLFQGEAAIEVAEFMDSMMTLGVEGVTISPGYSYERAPRQDVFLKRRESKQLFRDLFRLGRTRHWRFNQSSMYLDFLAGNQSYLCTPWGNPTRNVFGWQKPCYLLVGEGYASTFRSLIQDTDWSQYGTGRNPKCANCMVHCGYEPTAVNDTFRRPWRALRVALFGPRTEGPMVPEPEVLYEETEPRKPRLVAMTGRTAPGCGSKRVA
jgi:hopanoid biosynthesis associated radical SAM protein HpnH